MCVVSRTIDSVRKQWPPVRNWPPSVTREMSEIIRRLAAIEEKLGIRDCIDSDKEKFLQEIKQRFGLQDQQGGE